MSQFTIPEPVLVQLQDLARRIIAGMTEEELLDPDEWIEWNGQYDLNIYRDQDGVIAAVVYPVVPVPGTLSLFRTTDGTRFVRLSI